jgi:hypothetical protein
MIPVAILVLVVLLDTVVFLAIFNRCFFGFRLFFLFPIVIAGTWL